MNRTICSPIYPDSHGTEIAENLLKTYESICNNDDEYRCVYTTLNQRTYNGLNTKIQGPTEYKTLIKEKCGRFKQHFGENKIYRWANQSDPNCLQTVAVYF